MADNTSDPIVFVGGGEIIQPYQLLLESGAIADLTDCDVTVEICGRGGAVVFTLELDDGVTLTAPSPASATEAHGEWRLTEEQTPQLPLGMIAFARFVVVNGDEVTMTSYRDFLKRVG